MISTGTDEKTQILTMFGNISIVRDSVFCRRCHEGYGILDKQLEIYRKHRITKGMTELITYLSQLLPSFERASEALKKTVGVEVSPTQMQIVSEEVGEKVFKEDMEKARKAYEKPEEAAPQELPKDREEGRLYALTDGLQVNTRVEDKDGSTWKEMKMGMVFRDRNIIMRENGDHIITKKEYVSYLGSVNEFKKLMFAATARAGYGKVKELVVIGDGAQWIWNMCEELFPDAVQILDYYHFSENTHAYAKLIYPEDEVGRKKWVNEVLDAVTNGRVDKAVELVEEKKVDKVPDTVVNLYTYIHNNRERIDYKAFKKKGYYIGSGAIESANKMVIQQRMKQSGMRWSINGGQYIASLRTKYESKLWDKVVDVINAS
ncbi:MAG TPA: ISKra4 family transposase [Clostridiales bacterium]|nr:ISKra4 family transposase [Clostridiales bacterium]